MIKTDKHIKAIKLRDKYKSELLEIFKRESIKKLNKKLIPVYYDNWRERLLKLEYYIIDCKYNTFILVYKILFAVFLFFLWKFRLILHQVCFCYDYL